MSIIKVKNLSKTYLYYHKEPGILNSLKSLFYRKYYKNEALNNISFSISEGEFVGYIGPNGAGKTTTLKILTGVLFPTTGITEVLGFIPWKGKNEFKRNITFVMGQKQQLWWDLPAVETFNLNKEIYQIPDKEYKNTLEELVELLAVKDLLTVQVRKLSLGERMKMELIASLLHLPKVIFLDEPTIGLDFLSQKKIWDFLKRYNKLYNVTIMLTSHYLSDIKALCKKIIVINKGKIIYNGSLSDLTKNLREYKLISIEFSHYQKRKDDLAFLERQGQILMYKDNNIVVKVPSNESLQVVKECIEKFEIRDITIEDPPIEDIMEDLFGDYNET